METILNLRKFVMPEVVFGKGARKLAGQYAEKFSLKKVLLVTDKGIIENGWVEDVVKSLDELGIEYILFTELTPNPKDFEVMLGAESFKNNRCDGIIAIGGGSPMDLAKGVGIISTNGGMIVDYKGVDMITKAIPPMIFIPTTAGTSADVSQFGIISDTKKKIKVAIVSKNIIPDVALIDYETTLTMDNYLTACTGIDAFTHAIEAYVSKVSSPLTDIHAIEAINIIYNYLPLIIKEPDNLQYREKLMFASMEAGFAFSNAILGAVHAMAHSLGGLLDLPHGECNGILLNHVVDFNYSSTPDKFNKISEIIGIKMHNYNSQEKKLILFDKLQELKESIGIIKSLKELGVRESDIPLLAHNALNDACIITNPREAAKEDIEKIFYKAM
ncbi:MAG: iron-containing alcohol dehydrogenase [Fusobacteriaceae bacterium]|nr:iron-containing alcohol dehydrogenase [Fusobacteriaceae bacterium]MBP6466621.1 iron-containing alcohol dehydrogenase [Fusobacteriaceae bacterium]MBP8637469.1 iron-containing alcohol dehydrogenase [Leptotrichiaceae bacterium]MBP9595827.1 iron-containing alcohol dehydrogenase [Fusobacteriaceae bacterium]MBU9919296.1 iron-containing alcohol dehydrogenase [Fusobacteriaceae bacterium]